MSETLVVSLRAVVILAFLAVMPLLAIPAVGQKYDQWLRPASAEIKPTLAALAAPKSQSAGEPFVDFEPISCREPPTAPAPVAALPREGERFEAIPARLRELGADYLKLEAVDLTGTSYRFECRMPLSEHGVYSRPFAATAPDPVEAMERVLANVEAWQLAGNSQPEAHTTGRRR